MWIVRVALQRPYTFVVLAVLILLVSPVLILRTPTDIFPNIDIPVIAVAWQFTGLNFLRTQLVTVPGASIPYPFGGKQRQIMVDLDQRLLQSKGLSPADVVTALGQQNIVVPSGTAKIGQFEYDVAVNGSPRTVAELNDLPVKVVGNSTIYLRDVAHVRDGFAPQTNVVRRDGTRGTLVTILKTGAASTLDVVAGIRAMLPRVIPTMPPWRSRTSTATSTWASRSSRPSWTGRSRSRCRRSSPRCASASCFCRCSSWAGSPATSSSRSRRP